MNIALPRQRPRLFLVADNLGGGLGAAVTEEARYFSMRSWDVSILSPDAASSRGHHPSLLELGVEFVSIAIPDATRHVWHGLEAGRRIASVVKASGVPSVIHSHGLRSTLFVLLTYRGSPLVTTYHGGTVRSPSRRAIMSWQAASCALAISASPRPPKGYVFWPHASPHVHGAPKPPRTAPTGDQIRVGWFGRLESPKRPDLWLNAIQALRVLGIPATGHVVGEGSLLEALKTRATERQIPLHVYGAMPANEAIEVMDVMLAWSDSDALAFTIQESIWLGIPALTNDIPGPASILGSCRIGVVNSETVATTLAELCVPATYTSTVRSQQLALQNVVRPGDPLPKVFDAIESLLPDCIGH